MNSRLPSPFLFVLCFFSAQMMWAQHSAAVHLVGRAMRAPLDVPAGRTTVQLCDLTAGNTYTVIATGMAPGQKADFEIMAATALPAAESREKKNILRFTASSACVDLALQAHSAERVSSIPLFLSIRCESCPKDESWKEKILQGADVSVLEVNSSNAVDMITNTLIGGNCYNITNVTYNGRPGQIGTFAHGATNLGFESGIMLTTGDISVATGPNDQDNANGGYGGGTPDGDLSALASGSIVDRADIEFDFTPTVSQVTFDYVFASEEYCEYVNTQFNDVFGFFISGPGIVGTKNLAVIGPSTPVSINTVNHLTNSSLYVHNTPLFGNNCFVLPPSFGVAVNELQYDGFTKKLSAVANLIPCQTYHIKLKIADVADGLFDSGVFLRANSFAAGGSVAAETVYPANQSFAYEGCNSGFIRFTRNVVDINQPVPVAFSLSPSSTAVPGVDYAPLTGPYVIPAGQTELLVPVTIFNDQILEGEESIVLMISNSCSCTQSQISFLIRDRAALSVSLDDEAICNGSAATLSPTLTGGSPPVTYLWSTGDTTASIVVNPAVTTTYSVTVNDVCGEPVADTALVVVSPTIQTTQTFSFCAGDTVMLNGVIYTTSTSVSTTIPGNNGACDTVLTYVLQALPQIALADTIPFCAGTTVTLGGVVYSQSGTVVDTLPGMNGGCDTIITYVLQALQQFSINDTLVFCAGDTVHIGGEAYTMPGIVTDTLIGTNGGCDTLATYVLQMLPQPTLSDTIIFCAGDTVHIGGGTYTAPGTVTATLSGTNGGCDTLATYVLEMLPQPLLADTIAFCPGDTIHIGGGAYTQSGTVTEILPSSSGGCDTLVTHMLLLGTPPVLAQTVQLCAGDSIVLNGVVYTSPDTVSFPISAATGCDTLATYILEFSPHPTFTQTIAFCPGDSVVIGGLTYYQPDTISRILPATSGCDTLATYFLEFSPRPTVIRTVEFCAGDSVIIAGVTYSQPDTVVVVIPATVGCDTVATYVLKYLTPSGPTKVTINCPANLTVTATPNQASLPVIYSTPLAVSDCPCPGVNVHLEQGLASGSNFPVGTTKICYSAKDSCNNTATCCFNVSVVESSPCDVKVINCIKFELLSITEDIKKRKTYRIRTTNTCSDRMVFMFVQVPNGLVADLPQDNTIFTAPGGRTYRVRNPNFSPFYSLRFASLSDSIHNGESDVFKYTLQPQISPAYIHVAVRLESGQYYEAHLNTFFCEVGYDPNVTGEQKPDRSNDALSGSADFSLFPNPTDGTLFADLSAWSGQSVQLRVFSAQGRLLQTRRVAAEAQAQLIDLPANLDNGLYLLEITPGEGKALTRKFTIVH